MQTSQLQSKPFLWGPVKSALVQEAKAHGPDVLIDLCHTKEQRVKEMMVAALTDLGRDDLDMVDAILRKLFPEEKQSGVLKRAWQLVRKPAFSSDDATRGARQIGVEVAGNLGIAWALQAAALHPDSAVRAAALRATYHLWERDRKLVFDMLDFLADNIMHGPVPDLAAFEVVFGLSLTIFFDHQKNQPVLNQLQKVWRQIINSVFGISERSTLMEKPKEFIRERIFDFAIGHSFKLLKEMPKYNLVNYEDVQSFFALSKAEKALYKRLTRYMDVPAMQRGDYTREEMERDVMSILAVRSLLFEGVFWLVGAAHAVYRPNEFLPFLKSFVEKALEDPQPNPYILYAAWIPQSILHRTALGETGDAAFDLMLDLERICQEYYPTRRKIPGLSRVLTAPNSLRMNISAWQYRRTGTSKVDWLDEWHKRTLATAIEEKDTEMFEYLLTTELAMIGIEWGFPKPAFETLSLFVNDHGTGEFAAQVDGWIVNLLGRMRMRYPDDVDDFLDDHQASPEMQLQVRTKEPIETVGELIGGARAMSFVIDSNIDSPALREVITRVFSKAADAKDIRTWLDYIFREAVNVVYGGKVMKQDVW